MFEMRISDGMSTLSKSAHDFQRLSASAHVAHGKTDLLAFFSEILQVPLPFYVLNASLQILSDTWQSMENAVEMSTFCNDVCNKATRSSQFVTIQEGVP